MPATSPFFTATAATGFRLHHLLDTLVKGLFKLIESGIKIPGRDRLVTVWTRPIITPEPAHCLID